MAMASAEGELFNDTFVVEGVDMHDQGPDEPKKHEKKFDKDLIGPSLLQAADFTCVILVSRIDAKSENYETTLTLDVNMELYPLQDDERIRLLLASRLWDPVTDGGSDVDGYDHTRKLPPRAEDFDYIMSGKIFKYAETDGKAVVYASFGGLLMALKGEPRTLGARAFNVDAPLYLFLSKIVGK